MKYLMIFFLALFLVSCDRQYYIRGFVYDKENGLPLDSVAIGSSGEEDNSNYRKDYSGRDGSLSCSCISGGSKSMGWYFMKKGYKTIERDFPAKSDSVKIYLEKDTSK